VQSLESDALDLELNKALARYAAIEPRTGWKIASGKSAGRAEAGPGSRMVAAVDCGCRYSGGVARGFDILVEVRRTT